MQPVQKEAFSDEGRRQCRVPRGKGQGLYGFSQALVKKKLFVSTHPTDPIFVLTLNFFGGVFVDVLRANHCTVKKINGNKKFCLPTYRGGEISKIYTCPRTTGCKKALVRTKALLARTQINTKARFVKIMI